MNDLYECKINELFQTVSNDNFTQLDESLSAITRYFMYEYFSGNIAFDEIFLYQEKYQNKLLKMAYEAGRLE